MNEQIKWETPPPSSQGQVKRTSKWARVDAMLKERPGEWAMIIENPNHIPVPRMFAGPRYERAYRKGENGNRLTYVRFIGPLA